MKVLKTSVLLILSYLGYCHLFVFRGTKIYSGKLSPTEAHVCRGQSVTFTCQISSGDLPDGALYFAMALPKEHYVTVNDNDVIKDDTGRSANFTQRVTSASDHVTIRCYYGKKDDVNNPELVIGEPVLFPILPMPKQVQDFECVVDDYDIMICTWEYDMKYEEEWKLHVFLEWRLSGADKWNLCPELDQHKRWCIWLKSKDAKVFENEIDINITIKQPLCDASVHSNFTINPKLLVRPNPVTNLQSHVINSTCIGLEWNVDGLHHHDYKITLNCPWYNKKVVERDPADRDTGNVRTVTMCDLEEYTEYKITVSQKPRIGGFWSQPKTTEVKTLKDVPKHSPTLIKGGYFWDPEKCEDGGKTRSVCLMWQNIKPIDQNGEMRGTVITFTPDGCKGPEVHKRFSDDTTYECVRLSCNVTYIVEIFGRNDNGTSKIPSTMRVQQWRVDLKQPKFTIEMAPSSTHKGHSNIYVSLDTTDEEVTDIYVAWCVKLLDQCQRNAPVNWAQLPRNETTAIEIPDAPERYLYSVTVTYHTLSYGSQWEYCIYTKDVVPTVAPQNVIVTAGPEDNTLVVTWETLGCRSGQPLIVAYRVRYCQTSSGKCRAKTIPSNTSRLLLQDLAEDIEYTVQIQSVTANGLYSPFSQTVSGIPTTKSLKLSEIMGISFGGLTLVILAGLGCMFAFRMLRKRLMRWKKKVGAVKIPEQSGLDLMHLDGLNKTQTNLTK